MFEKKEFEKEGIVLKKNAIISAWAICGTSHSAYLFISARVHFVTRRKFLFPFNLCGFGNLIGFDKKQPSDFTRKAVFVVYSHKMARLLFTTAF